MRWLIVGAVLMAGWCACGAPGDAGGGDVTTHGGGVNVIIVQPDAGAEDAGPPNQVTR